MRCGYVFFTYNQKQNWLNIIIYNVVLRYKPRADEQSEVSQTAVYLGLHCIGFMRAESH